MTTTINAHRLARLFERTAPHIADEFVGPLHGIRLDCDGIHLYAVASDRYTLAATGAVLHQPADAWQCTLKAPDITALQVWLEAHDGAEPVRIDTSDNKVQFHSDRGSLHFHTAETGFPDWRGVLRTVLQEPLTESPFTALDTGFLARWQHAGRHLRFWQAAADKPLIVASDDGFLGLQMPSRPYADAGGNIASRDDIIRTWSIPSGDDNPVLPEAPLADTSLPSMVESLLRQTLTATEELWAGDLDTPQDRRALGAWAQSGVHAWMAFRFLDVLRTADPDLAARTVRDLDEELEAGEFSETAWDAATKAGHDPAQWRKERQAPKPAAPPRPTDGTDSPATTSPEG